MTKKEKAERKAQAMEWLSKHIKHKTTIYTMLLHVSSSGMTRHIAPLIVVDGKIVNISYWIADALGYRRNKRGDGLVIGGCGMDMGYSLVYNICSLFPFYYYKQENKGGTPSDDGTNCYGLNHVWL